MSAGVTTSSTTAAGGGTSSGSSYSNNSTALGTFASRYSQQQSSQPYGPSTTITSTSNTGTKKISFFMRKGADCLSKWVGEGERQLRLLFEQAKKFQPSIIFFDGT